MKMRSRLAKVSSIVQAHLPAADADEPPDEEGWLAIFARWGDEGFFAAEPDFPRALAEYRDALTRAKAQTDPPFDVPADFDASIPSAELRRHRWRTRERFPEVWDGWMWLAVIAERVWSDVPPVTEVEFADLAAWFDANQDRLYQASLPSQILDLGNGKRTSVTDLRWGVMQGPRDTRAGEVAELLRLLREAFQR